MIRRISIFSCFFVFTLFLSCNRNTVDLSLENYNQKANELILQVIMEDSCNCVKEIPKESMYQIVVMERPNVEPEIRKSMMQKLGLKSESEFDSLSKVSDNFVFDKNTLKQKNIKIISQEMINSIAKGKNSTELFKMCRKGILCIQKPIFDKHYKKAIINVGQPFVCSSGFIATYTRENGKWIQK